MSIFSNPIADNFLSALGLSSETKSWLTRLRAEITLTSPDGNEFTALWRGNPHVLTNKLGVHTFPGAVGAKIQDLRSGEEVYNLTILFTGKNNDINASAFMNSLKNNVGDWTIDHPTKGPLFMVWTNATEIIDPVESGNITIIDSSWIVNTPDSSEETASQAQAQAEFQKIIGNNSASDQFVANAKQNTPSQFQAIKNGIGKAITTAKKVLKLVENTVILGPELLAIEAAINNTLSNPTIDTNVLSGQVQAYIQLFGLGQVNATDAVAMYSDFIDVAITEIPSQADDTGETVVAVTELVVSAGMIGATSGALIGTLSESLPGTKIISSETSSRTPRIASQTFAGAPIITSDATVSDSGFSGVVSRSQLLSIVENLSDTFAGMTSGLDDIQTLYQDRAIDDRYFSQSTAYSDILLSVQASNNFLLLSLFGLPSERRIILKSDTFVPQIAKNEYGNIGNETSETFNIDLLIASNGLIEDDTYLLEAGRAVLIYV